METQNLTPSSLAGLLSSNDVYACIDVRERGEFALEQIPGVVPVARGTLEYRIEKMIPEKFIPVVICCDDGRRSDLASLTMIEMGYQYVKTLSNGLNGWKSAGFRTRSGWGVGGKEYGEKVANAEAISQISPKELFELQNRGKNIVLIDVRTTEEYLRGHVPGAFHVPGGQLLLHAPRLLENEDSMAIITCAGRTRGILGTQMLRDAGFRNVHALLNGAMGWKLAGYELENGAGRTPTGDLDARLKSLVVASTNALATSDVINFISWQEFIKLREAKAVYYLIDVRLPEEFRSKHVKNSISLPAGQIALAYENFIAVKKANIIIVSDDAIRPVWAAVLLKRLGFPQVFVLKGGIEAVATHEEQLITDQPETSVFGLERARRLVRGLLPNIDGKLFTTNSDTTILDVRGIGEFAIGHLPGARWLARGKLELDIENIVSDKEKRIVTVCDSGIRSTLAAATLKILGFHKVEYIDGGMQACERENLDVCDGLDGTRVTRQEAQADFGHTLWSGPLGKSKADMEDYLAWEETLIHTKKE